MKDLSKKLVEIEEKIRKLIHENKLLGQSNASLIDQNNILSEKLAAQESKVADMEDRLQVTSDTNVAAPNKDVKEISISSKQLKKQIDEYTKEIDKCIEYLYNN